MAHNARRIALELSGLLGFEHGIPTMIISAEDSTLRLRFQDSMDVAAALDILEEMWLQRWTSFEDEDDGSTGDPRLWPVRHAYSISDTDIEVTLEP